MLVTLAHPSDVLGQLLVSIAFMYLLEDGIILSIYLLALTTTLFLGFIKYKITAAILTVMLKVIREAELGRY